MPTTAGENIWKFCYEPTCDTPAMWKHTSHYIIFTLVLGVFGVKYTNRKDAEHLRTALKIFYLVTIDWTGSKHKGLTLKWDYINRMVDIYMPKYVPTSLHKFYHKALDKLQESPHHWSRPTYVQATRHENP